MSWPAHLQRIFHQSGDEGKAALLAVAKASGWGESPPPMVHDDNKAIVRSLPLAKQCMHLGKMLDKTKCGTETFACKIHGTCSQQPHRCGQMKLCQNCGEWKRHEIPSLPVGKSWRQITNLTVENTTRHLCYHIYPVKGNDAWRWNVEQLCGRMKCFNGKKIVAIVTDPPEGRKPDPTGPYSPDTGRVIRGCHSAEEVKEEFAKRTSDPIEFLEMENDPALREVKTIMPMLERVLSNDPYSLIFYGQAKGTTRQNGHIARRWTEALYEIYLDHFPLAIEQLREKPVTGAFKKLGPGWSAEQTHSDWHFSGSWAWFRAAALVERDWQRIDQFWSGIEPYPSQQFPCREAGCMFHEDAVPRINLYSARYWQSVVTPALGRWRVEMAKYRTEMWPR